MKDQIISDIFCYLVFYGGLDLKLSKLTNSDKIIQTERSIAEYIKRNPEKNLHLPHISEKDIREWTDRRNIRMNEESHKIKSTWDYKK